MSRCSSVPPSYWYDGPEDEPEPDGGCVCHDLPADACREVIDAGGCTRRD